MSATLVLEKVEGPSTSLTFLGILLDMQKMEARLPPEKLQRLKQEVSQWLVKDNATKRQILSLVGLLQHATKVVRCGRALVARMYSTVAKVQKLHYYTRLTHEFHSDLAWWYTFISLCNGVSLFQWSGSNRLPHCVLPTNVSGSWDCGSTFNGYWFQWKWPPELSPIPIMAKELAPITAESYRKNGAERSETHTHFFHLNGEKTSGTLIICDTAAVLVRSTAVNKHWKNTFISFTGHTH